MALPTIPETITVHLGKPRDAARNVTVPFVDYIKNVASSEIYPTWPEQALRANILAQISFALNRLYNEHYRSMGYDFDITNSTAYDQAFVENRNIFGNISVLVDELFNSYITKGDQIQPYFTAYCSGRGVNCEGLKQWDTVALAERGMSAFEILQYYYGNDINLVTDAPVRGIAESYPGLALRMGSIGEPVETIQRQLNRIAKNYPAIPQIQQVNGIFDGRTAAAVKAFQQIFDLQQDGVVGEATWYKIKRVYNAVKRVSELYSEGITVSDIERVFRSILRRGDTGLDVSTVQYYLDFIAQFNENVPRTAVDGVYGEQTQQAVRAFQQQYGLSADGIVGQQTWNQLQIAYTDILKALPEGFAGYQALYPGHFLTYGATGLAVQRLQEYLNVIAQHVPAIPLIGADGWFGSQTLNAVNAVQSYVGMPVTGNVGPVTWDAIVTLYNAYS